ncbi:MAG: hypothetical protein WCU90_09485 [Kiritimatiellia bacterium]
MKRIIFVFALLMLSLLVGCNNVSKIINGDNYYSVYTYSNYGGSIQLVTNTPKLCYSNFDEISDDITNASDYFSISTFEEHIVLCIVRNEEPASNYIDVLYSDFNISEDTLNITCYYVGDHIGNDQVCSQIDFVVIPKDELIDKDINNLCNDEIEFQWNVIKVEMFGSIVLEGVNDK